MSIVQLFSKEPSAVLFYQGTRFIFAESPDISRFKELAGDYYIEYMGKLYEINLLNFIENKAGNCIFVDLLPICN